MLQTGKRAYPERCKVTGGQKQEVQAQKLAEAPKADKSIPLEQYQELTSGQQVMFSYLANSDMPVDYDKSAQAISAEYRGQSDDFKNVIY